MAERKSIVIDFSEKGRASTYTKIWKSNENFIQPKRLECGWIPCCMNDEDAESFGHHVSIFMVALVAFATFFCVTFILILVFLLG